MQKPAKAMSPLTINISSSQFDIRHLRNPAAPREVRQISQE
jgi:hypothetical protein